MNEARGGHRHGRAFGFGQREPQILDGERRSQSRRAEMPIDNLSAVSLMDPGTEQRTGEDIEREMAVDAAFSQQGKHLARALKGRRGEDVSSELDQVCQSGVFANYEQPLTEAL